MERHCETAETVRADLHRQIADLQAHCRSMTMPALHEAVDRIRLVAHDHQLGSVEHVARSFERSIARHRRNTAFNLYFDQLRFAADCREDGDPAAREALLAAISVRLAG